MHGNFIRSLAVLPIFIKCISLWFLKIIHHVKNYKRTLFLVRDRVKHLTHSNTTLHINLDRTCIIAMGICHVLQCSITVGPIHVNDDNGSLPAGYFTLCAHASQFYIITVQYCYVMGFFLQITYRRHLVPHHFSNLYTI